MYKSSPLVHVEILAIIIFAIVTKHQLQLMYSNRPNENTKL